MSAANGPLTSTPRPRAAAAAGASTPSSSEPRTPPSPACGLSPAIASRGRMRPNFGSASLAIAIVWSTSSRVIIDGTSLSGTCTVINTTFNSGAWNIIATRDVPHRCASRSVCPFHGSPAFAKASLFTGAVAIASTAPLFAASTARTIVSCAAWPASAETSPTRNSSGGGANTTGSHTARTRASAAAFSTISGPMPAGSPTVNATRGFLIDLNSVSSEPQELQEPQEPQEPCLHLHRQPLGHELGAGVALQGRQRAIDGAKRIARAIAGEGPRQRLEIAGKHGIGQHGAVEIGRAHV